MANEISITTGLQVVNGTSRRPSNQLTRTFDQAAIGIAEATFALTTTDTAFNLPISSPGHAQLRNDGSTTIEWGPRQRQRWDRCGRRDFARCYDSDRNEVLLDADSSSNHVGRRNTIDCHRRDGSMSQDKHVYGFNRQDSDDLLDLIGKGRPRERNNYYESSGFIVVTPSGGIPKRVGNTVTMVECDLLLSGRYRFNQNENGSRF